MDALYRGWLIALRQLKEKYHKAGLRTVAPAKIKVSQRQRLPPTILSYTQTKTNNPLPKQTKTNNPLPKQTIVEPQTNIVQESRKRKGEELPHLFKRTRPTLLPHRQVPSKIILLENLLNIDDFKLNEYGPSMLIDPTTG